MTDRADEMPKGPALKAQLLVAMVHLVEDLRARVYDLRRLRTNIATYVECAVSDLKKAESNLNRIADELGYMDTQVTQLCDVASRSSLIRPLAEKLLEEGEMDGVLQVGIEMVDVQELNAELSTLKAEIEELLGLALGVREVMHCDQEFRVADGEDPKG